MSRMPSFHLSRTLRRATAFLGPFYLRQEHPPYIHRISTERKDGYATHAVFVSVLSTPREQFCSGSLAMLAAMRRASSLVSLLVEVKRS